MNLKKLIPLAAVLLSSKVFAAELIECSSASGAHFQAVTNQFSLMDVRLAQSNESDLTLYPNAKLGFLKTLNTDNPGRRVDDIIFIQILDQDNRPLVTVIEGQYIDRTSGTPVVHCELRY